MANSPLNHRHQQSASRDARTLLRCLVCVIVVLLGTPAAMSAGLPRSGDIVVISADGKVVVGTGRLAGSEIEIALLNGFRGVAHVLVLGRHGAIAKLEVDVRGQNNVMLLSKRRAVSLRAALSKMGLDLDLALTSEFEPVVHEASDDPELGALELFRLAESSSILDQVDEDAFPVGAPGAVGSHADASESEARIGLETDTDKDDDEDNEEDEDENGPTPGPDALLAP